VDLREPLLNNSLLSRIRSAALHRLYHKSTKEQLHILFHHSQCLHQPRLHRSHQRPKPLTFPSRHNILPFHRLSLGRLQSIPLYRMSPS
jgi:hypothetical protein